MAKKRYTLYISQPLARKFDLVAQQRQGAKSALVEEALRASLEPQQQPGIEEGLARRLNELNKVVAAVGRDVTVATETVALFVRSPHCHAAAAAQRPRVGAAHRQGTLPRIPDRGGPSCCRASAPRRRRLPDHHPR